MPLNRRLFMAGVGAIAGAKIMLNNVRPSQAAPSSPSGQVPGVYRTKIGSIRLTSVFDGGMQMGPGIVLHPQLNEINILKQKAFITSESIPGFLNTFVIETGGKTILVDTGLGVSGAPSAGRLLANLAAAGFKPDQIDQILLTHAHPDHVGGLTTKEGQPVFSKAAIRIAEEELAFWFDDAEKAKRPDKAQAFEAARKNLGPYKAMGRIETFKLGKDLGNGVASVDLRGHTPGHSGFRIADGHDQLLIWGDIVHMQALQFAHPEWSLTFDIDPEQAIRTRHKIMEEVSADRLRIAGMHLSFPGLGHVEKSDSGYALVPQMWESDI